MIHIQTVIADSQGYFATEESKTDSVFQKSTARVQRDKLLDGTTYLKKHAYSVGDRTFTIVSRHYLSKAEIAVIWNIHINHTKTLLSCVDGFFEGVIESVRTDQGKAEIVFIPEFKYA